MAGHVGSKEGQRTRQQGRFTVGTLFKRKVREEKMVQRYTGKTSDRHSSTKGAITDIHQ